MPTQLIEIRRFAPRDMDDAARAANAACWQAYAYFGYSHPVSTTRQRLLEALDEGQDFWVAEVAGSVAGIMTFRPNFIDKLFIAPHRQGLGLGSAAHGQGEVTLSRPSRTSLRAAELSAPAAFTSARVLPVTCRLENTIGIPEIVYRWNGQIVQPP